MEPRLEAIGLSCISMEVKESLEGRFNKEVVKLVKGLARDNCRGRWLPTYFFLKRLGVP